MTTPQDIVFELYGNWTPTDQMMLDLALEEQIRKDSENNKD